MARLQAWVKAQRKTEEKAEGEMQREHSNDRQGVQLRKNDDELGLEVERRSKNWRWVICSADFENILLMRSEGGDMAAMRLAQYDLSRAMKDCGIADIEAREAVGFISHL